MDGDKPEPLPADDLNVDEWAAELIGEAEHYLAGWAAFAVWLEEHEA